MRIVYAPAILIPLLLTSCMTSSQVPPADIPERATVHVTVATPPARDGWKPYKSGPLQSGSISQRLPRRHRDTAWQYHDRETPNAVVRSTLPDVSKTTVVSVNQPSKSYVPLAPKPPIARDPDSVFGAHIVSAWATVYVPKEHRTEFGIFAEKVAHDGQARMTMPTGEVYSGSVTQRRDNCVTLDIGVTADGSLPIISQGLVQVCR